MAQRARISGLNVYPVKSCRGIASASLRLAATGFERDRHWMIVRPGGRFVTQRELPRLALVRTGFTRDGLRLSAPGMADIEVPERTKGATQDVIVWRDTCRAIDQGAAVSEWLTRLLGTDLRLVAFDRAGERLCKPEWTGATRAVTQFADAFSILAISEGSLADLNTRLLKPLPMERFRPNIVLDGLEPYAEDRIAELALDGVRLRLVKPCDRCIVTTTNQSTGEVEGDEPLRTLKTYRWSKELKGVLFGQNGIVIEGAGRELRVGDEFDISWRLEAGTGIG
jgi:uncharacterized protein YcbX